MIYATRYSLSQPPTAFLPRSPRLTVKGDERSGTSQEPLTVRVSVGRLLLGRVARQMAS